MTSNISLYTLLLAFVISSCTYEKAPEFAPEYLYNVPGETVIKSIINNKTRTIALIYGNDQAQQTARDPLLRPVAGAHYTLVTWKQKAMPQWYGTNMNGRIYSVETLKISQRNKTGFAFNYEFRPGQSYLPSDRRPEKGHRFHFITAQHAAIFP